jgi:hypothetical protein
VGRDERTRVLAALGAGLTRELHPVFATLLGRAQLLLARAPDDPLREGWSRSGKPPGAAPISTGARLAEADQRGAIASCPPSRRKRWAGARRLPREAESPGPIEMARTWARAPPVEASAAAPRGGRQPRAERGGGDARGRDPRAHPRPRGRRRAVSGTRTRAPPEIRAASSIPFHHAAGHLGLGLTVAGRWYSARGRLEVERAGSGEAAEGHRVAARGGGAAGRARPEAAGSPPRPKPGGPLRSRLRARGRGGGRIAPGAGRLQLAGDIA